MENVRNEGTDKTNEEASLTKIMDGANEKNETIREGIVFVDEKSCNNTESDNKSKMLLLHQLANRLKKCEMYVGSYEEFYENSLLCETSFTNKEGESEMDTLKTNSEKQQKEEELREKLRAILNYRNSMATQIKLLYQLIEQLFDGKISILNEKLQGVETWLEKEGASLSHVLLCVNAKRSFLLQNEEGIRQTAELLEEIRNLLCLINTPLLSNILSIKERVKSLECTESILLLRLQKIQSEAENLVSLYSLSINLVTCVLKNAKKQHLLSYQSKEI